MKDLEAILQKSFEESTIPINKAIDHFFWRLIQVLFVVIVISLLGIYALKRKM